MVSHGAKFLFVPHGENPTPVMLNEKVYADTHDIIPLNRHIAIVPKQYRNGKDGLQYTIHGAVDGHGVQYVSTGPGPRKFTYVVPKGPPESHGPSPPSAGRRYNILDRPIPAQVRTGPYERSDLEQICIKLNLDINTLHLVRHAHDNIKVCILPQTLHQHGVMYRYTEIHPDHTYAIYSSVNTLHPMQTSLSLLFSDTPPLNAHGSHFPQATDPRINDPGRQWSKQMHQRSQMQNPKLPSVTSSEMTMHQLKQYVNQNNHPHPISVQDVSSRFSCPPGRHPFLLFYHNVTPGGPPNNALLTYRDISADGAHLVYTDPNGNYVSFSLHVDPDCTLNLTNTGSLSPRVVGSPPGSHGGSPGPMASHFQSSQHNAQIQPQAIQNKIYFEPETRIWLHEPTIIEKSGAKDCTELKQMLHAQIDHHVFILKNGTTGQFVMIPFRYTSHDGIEMTYYHDNGLMSVFPTTIPYKTTRNKKFQINSVYIDLSRHPEVFEEYNARLNAQAQIYQSQSSLSDSTNIIQSDHNVNTVSKPQATPLPTVVLPPPKKRLPADHRSIDIAHTPSDIMIHRKDAAIERLRMLNHANASNTYHIQALTWLRIFSSDGHRETEDVIAFWPKKVVFQTRIELELYQIDPASNKKAIYRLLRQDGTHMDNELYVHNLSEFDNEYFHTSFILAQHSPPWLLEAQLPPLIFITPQPHNTPLQPPPAFLSSIPELHGHSTLNRGLHASAPARIRVPPQPMPTRDHIKIKTDAVWHHYD